MNLTSNHLLTAAHALILTQPATTVPTQGQLCTSRRLGACWRSPKLPVHILKANADLPRPLAILLSLVCLLVPAAVLYAASKRQAEPPAPAAAAASGGGGSRIARVASGLLRFAAQPWFPWVAAAATAINLFTLVFTAGTVVLFLGAVLGQPKRWRSTALTNAIGATAGSAVLLLLLRQQGEGLLLEQVAEDRCGALRCALRCMVQCVAWCVAVPCIAWCVAWCSALRCVVRCVVQCVAWCVAWCSALRGALWRLVHYATRRPIDASAVPDGASLAGVGQDHLHHAAVRRGGHGTPTQPATQPATPSGQSLQPLPSSLQPMPSRLETHALQPAGVCTLPGARGQSASHPPPRHRLRHPLR